MGSGETRLHFERHGGIGEGAPGRCCRHSRCRPASGQFEEFGGRDADPEEAYLAEVEGSDIYVGILGKRFGKPLKSRFSPTHAEYRHAEQHALRMAV